MPGQFTTILYTRKNLAAAYTRFHRYLIMHPSVHAYQTFYNHHQFMHTPEDSEMHLLEVHCLLVSYRQHATFHAVASHG